jgi:YHS domain-containing protein
MSDRIRWFGKPLMMAGTVLALAAVLVVFSGCKKQPPAAQPKAQEMGQMPRHEHAAAAPAPAAATTEQTLCPVMGNPINKDIFVEYQGKKVYFCCKACPEVFLADPQKYLAKLPQFRP